MNDAEGAGVRRQRPLQDVAEPNLLNDVFPHVMVPRIRFDSHIFEEIDGQVLSFDPAERVQQDLHLTDTTFRDGQQSRPPYTVEQIATLYDKLAGLGGPNGVIRHSEFFLYSEKDRKAVAACREMGHPFPRIIGWIRADEGDLRLVKELELDEAAILTSCSDYLIFYRDGLDRRKAFDQYVRVVEEAVAAGIRPLCDLEDVTRADMEGFVLPFVQKLAQISESLPDALKVKVALCDTMGFGVPSPGAELPRSVPKLIYRMTHDGGIPSERLEWHGHNDFHKVHSNAATAWLYGANAVNASVLGIGERTGNPSLEGALIEYTALRGDSNGADLRRISEIADYFRDEMALVIPANYPFVGSNFNVTRAGIHAGGLRRDERTYNIFDTTGILGRPPRMAITDISGVDGVLLWVNDFLGLSGEDRLSKVGVLKVARWVVDEYESRGRSTAISDTELAEQVRSHLPEAYETAERAGRLLAVDGQPSTRAGL